MKTRLAARNEELPAGVDEARAFRLAMKIAPCGAKMKNELRPAQFNHAQHDFTTRQRDDINVIPLAMGEPNILAHACGRQTISPQCRRDSAETGGNAIKLSEPGGVDEGRQIVARSEA